ncbi:MAG: calcium/sodium antiporter [Elusimicrobiota bacterium]
MLYSIALFFLGIMFLWFGANKFIEGGSMIAGSLGVSTLIIGLTVGAVGTSLPELIVSWLAAGVGSSNISLGNVVGSNIANIGLALGLGAFVFPVPVEKDVKKYDYWILLISALGLFIVTRDLVFTGFEGKFFIIAFVLYVFFLIYRHKLDSRLDKEARVSQKSLSWGIIFFIAGATGLYFGAKIIVDTATEIAVNFGISEAIIGITAVAVGTSLPEVAVVLSGSIKKKPEISLGTIVGSNIINTFLIAGGASIISPVNIVKGEYLFQAPAVLIFTLLLFPAAFLGEKIERWGGAILLAGYIIYLIFLI